MARLDGRVAAGVPWRRSGPRGSLPEEATKLVAFDSAPFPYHGAVPGTGNAFLNIGEGGRKGHRSRRGRDFWEDETFSDSRVLMHIPNGFDTERPGVMVVFFHGHGATLERDVLSRQQVPAQISASGANAVLLAPQFAVDAPDSSAGRFWEQGGFARFLDEAAKQLARLHGNPAAVSKFASMPVVVVAYSGGFLPAAYALQAGGVQSCVRGVVLLDAMYGEHEKFANWITTMKSSFLVNASSHFTQPQAAALKDMLAGRDVPYGTELKGNLSRGGVTFLSTGPEVKHRDYVTQAWTEAPIKDILSRLPEYRLRNAEPVLSAEAKPARRERSATATARD